MMPHDNTKPEKDSMDNFPKDDSHDISKHFRLIANKWHIFVFGLLLSLCIAFAINKFTHPVYQGATTLLIRQSQNKPIGAEALVRDISFNTQNNIRNEIGVLKSYTLAKRTLESLDLDIKYFRIPRLFGKWRINALARQFYHDSPIIVSKKNNAAQLTEVPFIIRILSGTRYRLSFKAKIDEEVISQTDTFRFGQTIESQYFSFSVDLRDKYASELNDPKSPFFSHDYSFIFHNIEKLASQYSNDLKVNLYFNDASILELAMQGKHPEMITTFLNHHTQTFIESGLEEKNRIAKATIDFIDRQISGISDSLQEAESDFQKFRAQNRVVDISSEGNYIMKKLENLVTQKSNLQQKSKYYDYLYDYIQNQNEFNDVIVPSTMGISDPSLNRLVERLSQAYASRSRLLMTARNQSPQVQQITKEIQNIRQSLLENVRNIIEASNIQLDEVEKQIEAVNKQIQRLPGTEREYINIQRNFQLNDNIYTFLLQKRSEAGIALASNVSDHKIIDPAIVRNTKKSAPRPIANLIIAGILGLVLPAIGFVIGNNLNTRINSQFNIEDHTSIPIIGNIEHNRDHKKIPVIAAPRSPLAESFRAFRTNIDFMLGKNKRPAIIALTSSVSGEGKSFCSANLGAIFAITGKKVLVVGMDLRKPQTHTEFRIENKIGLSNYLIGSASFDETLAISSVNNLTVVPSGPIPPNPAELLNSEQMMNFLNEARQRFDIVILDTPPLALVADTLLITESTDLNLFVIRQGYSRKEAIKFINNLNKSGRIRETGIVVNDVKVTGSFSIGNKYGYGYGYGQFRKSGYYD
jgi:tyrosine-protein kinase Etk/Wzc